MNHQDVQNIAKETMLYAKTIIKPGMNIRVMRQQCEEK